MANQRCTILQGYQALERPRWIDLCMQSVRDWAGAHGHDHVFTDRFFEPVPTWFRAKCGTQIGPLTDLARTLWMQRCLDTGSDAVFWIDADVLVFAPGLLRLPRIDRLTAIRELTPLVNAHGQINMTGEGVNGAILGAPAGNDGLADYRRSIEACVRDAAPGAIVRTMAGPALLTTIGQTVGLGMIDNIGLVTPAMAGALLRGEPALPRAYMTAFGSPLYAANLCHFVRGEGSAADRQRFDRAMEQLIALLLRDEGDAINRWLPPNDAL